MAGITQLELESRGSNPAMVTHSMSSMMISYKKLRLEVTARDGKIATQSLHTSLTVCSIIGDALRRLVNDKFSNCNL